MTQNGDGEPPPSVAIGAPGYFYPHTVIPAPEAVTARRGFGKQIGAVIATVVVLVAAVGAYLAYAALNGGGPQPEQVLPSTTVAFAKVDFNPSASQKIATYRLVQKFPDLAKHSTSKGDIKGALLTDVFKGNDFGWTYAADVKPWLGDRIAAAAVADSTAKDGVDPVLVLAYTDEAKMKTAMTKAAATDKGFGYATSNHFVLISDSQAHADALVAAAKTRTLADSAHFDADKHSLPGNQIALGWVDVGAAYRAVPSRSRQSFASLGEPGGRFVVGVHAAADYVEMTGSGRDITGLPDVPNIGTAPGTGMIATLPADTDVAVSVTGLGEFVTHLYTKLTQTSDAASITGELTQQASAFGIHLPDDLNALFGSETLVAVAASGKDDVRVAVRVRTSKPATARRVIDAVTRGQDRVTTLSTPDGYVAGNDPVLASHLAAGDGSLGRDPQFRMAVPGAATAGFVAYVDLGHLSALETGTRAGTANLAHLGALGVTATGGPDATFTVRLTTR